MNPRGYQNFNTIYRKVKSTYLFAEHLALHYNRHILEIDSHETNMSNTSSTPQPLPVMVQALHKGLVSISQSANTLAEHVAANPSIDTVASVTDAAGGLHKQFGELIDGASKLAENSHELHGMMEYVSETNKWISSNFPSGNTQPVQVVNSFSDLIR